MRKKVRSVGAMKSVLKSSFDVDWYSALQLLTKCLHTHYGQRCIILIDEYDAPLEKAQHKGYVEEANDILQGMLSSEWNTRYCKSNRTLPEETG